VDKVLRPVAPHNKLDNLRNQLLLKLHSHKHRRNPLLRLHHKLINLQVKVFVLRHHSPLYRLNPVQVILINIKQHKMIQRL
jgi:hypothetical protein